MRAAEAHEVAHDVAPGGAIAMAAPLPGDTPHVWMCIAIPPDVSAGESVLIDTPHGTPLRPSAPRNPATRLPFPPIFPSSAFPSSASPSSAFPSSSLPPPLSPSATRAERGDAPAGLVAVLLN